MTRSIYLFLLTALAAILLSCGDSSQTSSASSDSQPASIENMPVGVALYSFNRFPLPETLKKSKQAGVTLVEGFFFHQLGGEFGEKRIPDLADDEVTSLMKMIDDSGLTMESMYAGGNTAAEWKSQFEIGQKMGLSFLVGEPEPELWDAIDDMAGQHGLKLAIHEHARGKSIFWHPDSVLAAIEGHENFGACGDLGHWVRSGLDPVECLKALEGHLISIHAKDLDEFGNIDANDIKLGTGVIDYPAVMAELKRQNFQGPIYVECEHDWEDNLEDVKYAVEYLEKLN